MSRFWLPATAVWSTRRPHTPPHQEHPSISWAVVYCEELCRSPKETCKLLVGVLCLTLCTPNFDQFRPLHHLSKSRCRPLLRICKRPISGETQAAVMNIFFNHRRSPVSANQPKILNKACSSSHFFVISVPIKHLEIIEWPGTRGSGNARVPPWP